MKTMRGSDEPNPHPAISFTYRTEQFRANEVQMEIVYNIYIYIYIYIHEGWNFNSGNYLFTTDTK